LVAGTRRTASRLDRAQAATIDIRLGSSARAYQDRTGVSAAFERDLVERESHRANPSAFPPFFVGGCAPGESKLFFWGDVSVGDEVELWGSQVRAADVAENADTIDYQLFTGLANRVHRSGLSESGTQDWRGLSC
jgi:hypothetical protein